MIRGTTAQFKFKLPYPKEEISWITIRFWQPNNPSDLLPITKKENCCVVLDNPNEVYVSLTAEETARFSDKYKAKLQLRGLHTSSGTVFGNKPKLITVYPMDNGVIQEDSPVGEYIIYDGKEISTWQTDNMMVTYDANTILEGQEGS